MLLLRWVWQRYFGARLTVLWELLRDGLHFLDIAARSRTALAAKVLFLLSNWLTTGITKSGVAASPMRHDCRWSSGPGFSKKRSWWLPPDLCALASQGFQAVLALEVRRRPASASQGHTLAHRSHGEGDLTWGEERVADELSFKLGILVSPRTVRKYWPRQPDGIWQRRTSSQHWRTFVKKRSTGPSGARGLKEKDR